jgi:hypothetical protein
MPLKKGAKNVGYNIEELHNGPQYAKNTKKFGKAKADKIAVAAAESAARGHKDIQHKGYIHQTASKSQGGLDAQSQSDATAAFAAYVPPSEQPIQ